MERHRVRLAQGTPKVQSCRLNNFTRRHQGLYRIKVPVEFGRSSSAAESGNSPTCSARSSVCSRAASVGSWSACTLAALCMLFLPPWALGLDRGASQ